MNQPTPPLFPLVAVDDAVVVVVGGGVADGWMDG